MFLFFTAKLFLNTICLLDFQVKKGVGDKKDMNPFYFSHAF